MELLFSADVLSLFSYLIIVAAVVSNLLLFDFRKYVFTDISVNVKSSIP